MPVRTIEAPEGRKFKLGRRRPVALHQHLHFSRYKLPGVTPPDTLDETQGEAAAEVLQEMYLNDTEGDCVIAAIAHATGLLQAAAKRNPVIFTSDQLNALYSAIGGFDPNNPEATDNGCDIQTALAYWHANGAPIGSDHKIAGYLGVDGSRQQDVMTALWLFGCLLPGIELPDRWVSNMPSKSGFTWDVAGRPDPQNGHCPLIIPRYDSQGVGTSTWAMTGTITWAAMARYTVARAGGELWVPLNKDIIDAASQKAPNGYDWGTLVGDFTALGGTASMPSQKQIDAEFKNER